MMTKAGGCSETFVADGNHGDGLSQADAVAVMHQHTALSTTPCKAH